MCVCEHMNMRVWCLDVSDFGGEGGEKRPAGLLPFFALSAPTSPPRGGDRTHLFLKDKGPLTTSTELGEVGTEHTGSLLV